ncbi:MAG: GNAT family N-acetyltransferase [Clostridia bacterium]|nr:GNAT family N-acetyltransferase [Clostridia bacterium]
MAKFDTLRIRAGYDSREHNYSVNVPIYQTAAFDLDSIDRADRIWTLEEDAAIYSRVGNPTVAILEERIKALSGAYGVLALSSGMAAISYTILALTEYGGNIVAPNSLYGGTEDAFSHFFPRFGAQIKFVNDRFDTASYEQAIDENTRGIYIESISNPNGEVYDIEALAQLAHQYHIPLIVDNTVATPYLLDPIRYGADIVIYSATKALSGHGNVIGGIIVDSGNFRYSKEKFHQFYEDSYKLKDINGSRRSPFDVDNRSPFLVHLRAFYLEFIGAALSPFDAYLIIQGLDTISERVSKQSENAEKLVRYLEESKYVSWVNYPAAKNGRTADLAKKYLTKGYGGILSFGFDGTDDELNSFIRQLQYFSYHVNIGDVRSLIVNCARTTHAEMDSDHLNRADIAENTIRISAGLESAEDLIDDLDHAFSRLFGLREINFTQAGINDLDEIARLELICFSPDKAATRETFEYRLSKFPQWFITARHNGRVVGLINAAPTDRDYITDDVYLPDGHYSSSGKSIFVYGLEVHPDYRGKGIADRLLRELVKKARAEGKTRAALTCVEKLIPFYEAHGFRLNGISNSVIGEEISYDMSIEFNSKNVL